MSNPTSGHLDVPTFCPAILEPSYSLLSQRIWFKPLVTGTSIHPIPSSSSVILLHRSDSHCAMRVRCWKQKLITWQKLCQYFGCNFYRRNVEIKVKQNIKPILCAATISRCVKLSHNKSSLARTDHGTHGLLQQSHTKAISRNTLVS